MKLVVRHRDGVVRLVLAARGQAREELGVEEGHPGRAAGAAPVEEGKERARESRICRGPVVC